MSSRSAVDRAPTQSPRGHGFYCCQGLGLFSLSHARVTLITSPLSIAGHIHLLGIGLELACNGGSFGGIPLKRGPFVFEKTPHISLNCELVPVPYPEYDTGLLSTQITPLVNFSQRGVCCLTHQKYSFIALCISKNSTFNLLSCDLFTC